MQCFQNVLAKNHLGQLGNYINYQTFPPGNSSVVLGWGSGLWISTLGDSYFQAILDKSYKSSYKSTLYIVKPEFGFLLNVWISRSLEKEQFSAV